MNKYAIIETGGKQYLVTEGDIIKVGKLNIEIEKNTNFKDKLSDKNVSVTIIGHGRYKKIRVIKFHNKTRSFRRAGHRQDYSQIRIEKLFSK